MRVHHHRRRRRRRRRHAMVPVAMGRRLEPRRLVVHRNDRRHRRQAHPDRVVRSSSCQNEQERERHDADFLVG